MKPVIVKKKQPAAKSRAYARYEKLIAEIEYQQQYTFNIHEGLRKAQIKINEEIAPLQKQYNLLLRDYVLRLDELASELGIGKYNKEYFDEYMSEELDALLDFFGHQDKKLSKLYEKYVGISIDDIANSDEITATVQALKKMFGIEIDTKEFLEKGQTAYFEEIKKQIDSKNNNAEHFEAGSEFEKEEKQASKKVFEDDNQLAKDARSIYMRLIKKFHPDLEKEPELKIQKTEIVKNVTQAYQEKDFFTLLKLQVTYMDDNEADAAAIADDMVKRYNKLLQKQLDKINQELQRMFFADQDIIEDYIDKNGKFSAQKFTARKRGLEKENASFKLSLSNSQKRPKGWFKDEISEIKNVVMQSMMQNIMGDMFSNFNI